MYDNICKCLNNQPLCEYSSMKTGGSARLLMLPQSVQQLTDVICELRRNNEKYIVFGNLSNVLIPDEGLSIAVVLTEGVNQVSIDENANGSVSVFASSGVQISRLAFDMCKSGFSGLEFAYGIPGTVGGAAFMNAGAYGGEFCNIASSVCVLDVNGNVVTRANADCGFDYRKSIFQSNGDVILGAYLTLKERDAEECLSEAKDYMARRIDKQPLEYPSCGSTFVRPEGYFAGKLIEDAGLKGYMVGGACVSEKHAGFVINKGNATTNDVLTLMRDVRATVLQNSGVTLQPEIRILNTDGEVCGL